MEINFNKIKPFQTVSALTIIPCILLGYLLLFVYNPTFFTSTDLFRLSVISGAISVPGCAINIFYITAVFKHIYSTENHENDTIQYIIIHVGSLLTIFNYSLVALLGYSHSFSIRNGIKAFCIIELIFFATIFFVMYLSKRKKT
jgi:hypothetical protein